MIQPQKTPKYKKTKDLKTKGSKDRKVFRAFVLLRSQL